MLPATLARLAVVLKGGRHQTMCDSAGPRIAHGSSGCGLPCLLAAMLSELPVEYGAAVQSDEAADRKLAAGRPELCGQGAIVNVGSFTCSSSGLERLDHPHVGQHELYDSDLDR